MGARSPSDYTVAVVAYAHRVRQWASRLAYVRRGHSPAGRPWCVCSGGGGGEREDGVSEADYEERGRRRCYRVLRWIPVISASQRSLGNRQTPPRAPKSVSPGSVLVLSSSVLPRSPHRSLGALLERAQTCIAIRVHTYPAFGPVRLDWTGTASCASHLHSSTEKEQLPLRRK